jgi:hypothetical protein
MMAEPETASVYHSPVHNISPPIKGGEEFGKWPQIGSDPGCCHSGRSESEDPESIALFEIWNVEFGI